MTLLEARSVSAAYGRRIVFRDVSLTASPGEVMCVIGPNGAGKSTLLRILGGLTRPASGEVLLHQDGAAADLFALPPKARGRRVGASFGPPDTTFGFTARELVVMGRYPHTGRLTFESDADRSAAGEALVAMALNEVADTPIHRLSSGERQRVGLARLLCQRPSVYLFDEPTSNLDPRHAEGFVTVARGLARSGAALLCVVHDLDLAMRLADRIVILAGGGVAAAGPPAAVMTPERIAEVWGVIATRADALLGRPGVVLAPRR